MPMTGLARVLTAQGLKALAARGNPGLAALASRAGASARPTAYDLGFVLGPRINAAGRIGHARLAFELLTTGDASRRALLAERLHVLNAERQEIERQVQADALAQIGEAPSTVIVAAGEGWHPGVVGIVAGRIKDRFDRPAIIIGVDGGVGKGSARSVEGVDIGAAVRRAVAEGLLAAGGGHAMAAGMTIEPARIGAFSAFLNESLTADCDASAARWVRRVDAVIGLPAATASVAEEIGLAGPFGPGNPEPVFAAPDLRVESVREVGRGHLALSLVDMAGETRRAIAFRAIGEPLEATLRSGKRLHVLARLKADDWGGEARVQLQIIDAAEAA
jgi:single-stranded-DNA-specific exonuclease